MPVIIVGADTENGRAIAEGLGSPDREVRVFVTDPSEGLSFKSSGLKVAVGDVSDESHIEGACIGCFTAVLVVEAAEDKRERSFASSAEEVTAGWARAVDRAGVRRVIWVSDADPAVTPTAEVARVDPSDDDLVGRIVSLDDAQLAG